MGDPLRVIGGATCLAAIVVAAITARFGLREPSQRTRFISEILASWTRRGGDAPHGLAWWGSAIANLLLGAGSILYAIEASRRPGVELVPIFATSLTLLAVAAIPLRDVAPRTARGRDFAHPLAAAAFYLAALVLGVVELRTAAPIGHALSIVHIATSAALIGLSIATSFLEFGPQGGALPFLGTRILLDRRADSRARWVRWLQWPATLAVGVSLCLGPLHI